MNAVQQAALEAGVRQVTIKGISYQFTLLPAFPGIELAKEIISLILPSAGAGGDGYLASKNGSVFDESSTFTDIAILLTSRLGEFDTTAVLTTLLSGVSADGVEIDCNKYFSGRYSELTLLMEACMKENFGDFFTEYLQAKGLLIPFLEIVNKVKSGQTPTPSQ